MSFLGLQEASGATFGPQVGLEVIRDLQCALNAFKRKIAPAAVAPPTFTKAKLKAVARPRARARAREGRSLASLPLAIGFTLTHAEFFGDFLEGGFFVELFVGHQLTHALRQARA
jgi:hypothetical protein